VWRQQWSVRARSREYNCLALRSSAVAPRRDNDSATTLLSRPADLDVNDRRNGIKAVRPATLAHHNAADRHGTVSDTSIDVFLHFVRGD
jgi:hypothetical protein